jgi:hypothetical protein
MYAAGGFQKTACVQTQGDTFFERPIAHAPSSQTAVQADHIRDVVRFQQCRDLPVAHHPGTVQMNHVGID